MKVAFFDEKLNIDIKDIIISVNSLIIYQFKYI